MSWKDSIVEWFDGFGSISLAAMSFTEAIIQPVPPDLLFLPMLVNADGDSALVMWLWIVITVGIAHVIFEQGFNSICDK